MPAVKRSRSKSRSFSRSRSVSRPLKYRARQINATNSVLAANKTRVKLCWGFNEVFMSAAVAGSHAFRLNSLFDPDLTGTGTQPVGFDQWAAFYNRYIVYACKIEWYLQTTLPLAVATHASNNDTAVGVPTVLGQPLSHINACGVSDKAHGVEYYDLAKLTGRTFTEYMADDRFQALTSANPSEVAVWRMRADSAGGVNTSADLVAKFTFWCEFSDRNQLAES